MCVNLRQFSWMFQKCSSGSRFIKSRALNWSFHNNIKAYVLVYQIIKVVTFCKKINVSCLFVHSVWIVPLHVPGVLLGPEFRGDSLRTESISSSPSPVLPSTPMPAATHSKTGSRDSCTQTEKGQEASKPSTPALQSVPGPSRISSPSPIYIPDRIAGTAYTCTKSH